MKWSSQKRKVEALAAKSTLLSVQSQAMKQTLKDKTVEQLRKPETLIFAFAAGVFWYSNPSAKRFGRVQSLLKFASTTTYILKLLGIPLPVRRPV